MLDELSYFGLDKSDAEKRNAEERSGKFESISGPIFYRNIEKKNRQVNNE